MRTKKTKTKKPLNKRQKENLDPLLYTKAGTLRKFSPLRIKKYGKTVDGRLLNIRKKRAEAKAKRQAELEDKGLKGTLTIKELKELNHKCTTEVIGLLVAGYQRDYTDDEACDQADITRDTLDRWKKQSDEFARKMEKAHSSYFRKLKNIVIDDALGKTIKKKVKDEVTGAVVEIEEVIPPSANRAMSLLIRRQSDRYAITKKVDLSNPDGSLQNNNPFDLLPLERRIELIRELETIQEGIEAANEPEDDGIEDIDDLEPED